MLLKKAICLTDMLLLFKKKNKLRDSGLHASLTGSVLLFLKKKDGDSIKVVVTGKRKKGLGLEVPCTYSYHGPLTMMKLYCIYTATGN